MDSSMTPAAASLWKEHTHNEIPPNVILAEHVRIRRLANFGNFQIPYHHHGIRLTCDDGLEFIIHYTGSPQTMTGEIKIDTVENFVGWNPNNEPIEVVEEQKPMTLDKIIERAKSRLGERDYNLVSNNCEHFATWCVYGEAVSRQVQMFTQMFFGSSSFNLNNFQVPQS